MPPDAASGSIPQPNHDRVADPIEIVISRHGLALLPANDGEFNGQTDKPIVLSVRNLTKTYRAPGEQIGFLRGVDLSGAVGEFVVLSGDSCSGKSTLLYLIAGLEHADRGEITLPDSS